MVTPIALYPDALLAQVLMQNQPWDPSVEGLTSKTNIALYSKSNKVNVSGRPISELENDPAHHGAVQIGKAIQGIRLAKASKRFNPSVLEIGLRYFGTFKQLVEEQSSRTRSIDQHSIANYRSQTSTN